MSRQFWNTLGATSATTLLVTAASYGVPDAWAGTAVALTFLAATYVLCLRRTEGEDPGTFGLALGGLLETAPLSLERMTKETWAALKMAAVPIVIFFPFFILAFPLWYGINVPFSFERALTNLSSPGTSLLDLVLGQLLVVALPEEAFFRGYAQTAFSRAFPRKWRIFGASLGPEVLITGLVFSVGHLFTIPDPGRLAVFFPSLVFAWLRARTGGIGAGVFFHAAANLLSALLAAGFSPR